MKRAASSSILLQPPSDPGAGAEPGLSPSRASWRLAPATPGDGGATAGSSPQRFIALAVRLPARRPGASPSLPAGGSSRSPRVPRRRQGCRRSGALPSAPARLGEAERPKLTAAANEPAVMHSWLFITLGFLTFGSVNGFVSSPLPCPPTSLPVAAQDQL